MFNNKPLLILLIERSSITFGGGSLDTPQRYELPASIYFDLEIINSTTFLSYIETILSKLKIVSNQFAIVFHESICFEKTLPKDTKDIHAAAQDFLDLIPLEKRMSKVIKHGNEMRVVCVNLEVYELLCRIFIKKGFTCKFVLTSSSLDPKISLLPLTQHAVQYISKNASSLASSTIVKGES